MSKISDKPSGEFTFPAGLRCRLATWTAAAAGIITLCNAAWANPTPGMMWLDEYGAGYFWHYRLPSMQIPDPTGGVPGPVLVYFLPPDLNPVTGDVVLTEPGGLGWSDVIRYAFFNSDPRRPILIYYSNGNDGLGLPADVPSMPQLMPNNVFMEEGSYWTVYTPMSDQPGFSLTYRWHAPIVFYGEHPSYNPSDGGMSIGLLGIGFAGILLLARAKARRLPEGVGAGDR
jgi:hypothetical protein